MRWKREETINELDRILGEPRGAVLYLSLAMMLPFIAARLNVFVDTAWVSELGQSAITAVSW